jgi:hypothetical protein
MVYRKSGRVLSGLNVLVGLWLIASPFALKYANISSIYLDSIISGSVIAVVGLVRAAKPEKTEWLTVISFIFGLWTIITPFLVGSLSRATTFNDVIAGIAVAIFAGVSARESQATSRSKSAIA